MSSLLQKLRADFADLSFVGGKTFCWSPSSRQVFFKTSTRGTTAVFSLLHEVGHATLQHRRYQLDFELLELEVAAWEQARLLGKDYGITIDEDHIQNCLDTYRDWLYRRSICPTCFTKALQQDATHTEKPAYRCYNCHATWQVASSRFCRPYRQIKGQPAVNVFAAETND